jgi:hypothetical protein
MLQYTRHHWAYRESQKSVRSIIIMQIMMTNTISHLGPTTVRYITEHKFLAGFTYENPHAIQHITHEIFMYETVD